MSGLLQIELNEVNFDFVQAYGELGELPVLNGLISAHGLTQTTSEARYDELEPWIQWVTAHTGLAFADHQVFRLGDIVSRSDLTQIWEKLEAQGLLVGAISPMNAANRLSNAAFFVPDPWTQTAVTGDGQARRLHRGAAALVNDNAGEGGGAVRHLFDLGVGLASYARPSSYARYAQIAAASVKHKWQRALILDQALADMFLTSTRRHQPDYATLFLNAAAHIQHHYMFNAAVYRGHQRNPDWYIDRTTDPLLAVYRLYDAIVGKILALSGDYRIVLATGLHQDPYPHELYYWRLADHSAFLAELGIVGAWVEPLMSRDFVVICNDPAEAECAAAVLEAIVADDGKALFSVDRRDDGSLFVMLVYPSDIAANLGYSHGNRKFADLRSKVGFVAIKNGEHNGIGYLVDTRHTPKSAPPSMPLAKLFDLTLEHFARPSLLAASR